MSEYKYFFEKVGIKTHKNPIVEQNGSALLCTNFDLIRDNIYKKSRGRIAYGSGLPEDCTFLQLLQYQSRLFVHLSKDTAFNIYYDSDGVGTFTKKVDNNANDLFYAPTNWKIKSIEENGNLYITSSIGIQKLDSLSGTFKKAGTKKCLGSDLRIIDITGNWLPTANAVSYRTLSYYKDANNNQIIGSPSDRQDISNASGADRSVELKIFLSDDITVNHTIEIYRSSAITSSSVPPEDFQQVYEANPTSAEVAQGYMIVNDIVPETFRGKALYTNPTQEGIQKSKDLPPLAQSITKFRTRTFYGNIKTTQELNTTLISASKLIPGSSTLTIANGTESLIIGCVTEISDKTLNAVANNGGVCELTTSINHGYSTGMFLRLVDIVGAGGFDTNATGVWKITVTALNKFTITLAWNAGYTCTSGTSILHEDIDTSPRFIQYTSGTSSQNIDKTARSIVKALQLSSGNTKWDAYYTSGYADLPGKFLIRNKIVGDALFYLTTSDDVTKTCFSPQIPTSGTNYKSTNNEFKNGILYSEDNQPEAVPSLNILYVGSSNDDIIDIVGLRDALYIIKKNNGIWRLTGDTPSSFLCTEVDGTVECLQPFSIAKGENSIFMMSCNGYVRIADTGVEIIGRDIELDTYRTIYNSGYQEAGYGWVYETEKSYFISTFLNQSSTQVDITRVYNTTTNGWTTRGYGMYTNGPSIKMGLVVDNLMYMAPMTGNQILKERKSYNANDFYEPDISVNIDSITGNLVHLIDPIVIPTECILVQGDNTFTIQSINSTGTVLTFLSTDSIVLGAATIKQGVDSDITFNPVHCSIPDWEKVFQRLLIFFDNNETNISNIHIYTSTNSELDEIETQWNPNYSNPFGALPWGELWGEKTITDFMNMLIPDKHSLANFLKIRLRHCRAGENMALTGLSFIFEQTDNRGGN